jgi:hypothetical protein
MIAALLLSAAPLAAQCTPVFSFSVYNDGSVSADGSTMYGYTSTEDSSTLCSCSHSGYTAVAAVYDPNGTMLGESEQSGFSSSVSELMDGVSGNYQSSGGGVAFCSCLNGYFGGGGTIYYVAVTCPTTISLAGTQSLPLANAYPSSKTGVGIMATMQVASGSLNGSLVTESLTGTNSCPAGVANACVGGSTFTVGPGSPYNGAGTVFGTSYSGAGNNQFLDQHTFTSSGDVLSGQTSAYSCQQTCTQTYSACGTSIGGFNLTYTFTHSSLSGTPVTSIGVTKVHQ